MGTRFENITLSRTQSLKGFGLCGLWFLLMIAIAAAPDGIYKVCASVIAVGYMPIMAVLSARVVNRERTML